MPNHDIFECSICREIPAEERKEFLNGLNPLSRKFKKGDLVARQGDPVNTLYILTKGSVKTEMITRSGSTLSIEIIKAPNPLASAFLFAEDNRFPVDVTALENVEIVLIPKQNVLKQLAGNEKFLQAYMSFNSGRTHFLSERIKLLSLKTIKGKLAYYILERSRNNHFTMDMNQTELSEYFGVARPSLARSLAEMSEDGIIELSKRNGKILDLDKLKELIIT